MDDDLDDAALAAFDLEGFVAQQQQNKTSSPALPTAAASYQPPPPQPPSQHAQFLSSHEVTSGSGGAPRSVVNPPRRWSVQCPADLTTPLFQLFGHEQFRDGQEDAVRATLQGRDACVY